MKLEVISRHPEAEAHKTPLLFIHGAWHAAWCWDVHFLDFFARNGFSAYAMSFRGHGASEGPKHLRWTSVQDYVDDVVSVVSQMPSPPVVIGHSLGGYVVLKYIETHPVPAAVVLSTMPWQGSLRNAFRLAALSPTAFLQSGLTLTMYPFVSNPKRARAGLFSSGLSDEKVHQYWEKLQDESVLVFLQFLFSRARKPRTKSPVFVLGDELDALVCQDQFEATARSFGSTATIIHGIAHDQMLEPKWEEAATDILEWLKRTLQPSH
jgi:pimeloyl-ACP methyl ester carboxylesterase